MDRMAKTLLILAVLWAAPVHAIEWGPYVASYVRAYDGDTVTLKILIWPDLNKVATVRLRGIDAPEIRGECDREKRRAWAARDFVRDALGEASSVFVTIHGFDKYGRALADIDINGEDLAGQVVEAGHAREYDGGVRLGWCGSPS